MCQHCFSAVIKTLCPFFRASYGSVTVWGALHILNPSFIPLEYQTPDFKVKVLSSSGVTACLKKLSSRPFILQVERLRLGKGGW